MKRVVIGMLCCTVLGIAGCDLFASAQDHIERANKAEMQGNYGLAAVELRNALQSEPANVAARTKLVKVLLLQSNATAADVEATPLRKSTAVSAADSAEVADVLARVSLAKGDFKGLLAAIKSGEILLTPPKLWLREAQALEGLNQLPAASEKIQQLLQQDPKNIDALVNYAQLRLATGHIDQALQQLDAALVQVPSDAHAWLAKGLVEARQGNTVAANRSLQNAVDHSATQLTRAEETNALAVLIENELTVGKIDAATKRQQRLIAIAPQSLAVQITAAQLALANSDYSGAISVLQKVLAARSDLPGARALLGRALAAQGNLRQAELELEKLLAVSSNDVAGRKLLAGVDLKLEQPVRAVEVLAPILATAQSDGQVAALITQAQIAVAKSSDDVERVLALQKRTPEDESLRLMACGVLLRANRVDQALAMLKDTSLGSLDVGRVPLLLAVLEQNKGSAAARLEADRLGAANAGDTRFLATLGLFFVSKQDYASARVWLQRALAQLHTPKDHKVKASSDLDHNDDDASAINENDALAFRTSELRLVYAIGLVDARSGDKKAALAGIGAYRQAHPDDLMAVAIEGHILMELKDFSAAAIDYETVAAKAPNRQVVISLYRARRLAGQTTAAQPLERWLHDHPEDTAVRMTLAEAYQLAGNANGAIEQYEQLVAEQPANVAALNNLAWQYQVKGDKRAEATARLAYDRAQKSPEVADTYGWILLQSGQVAEAVKILAAASTARLQNPDIRFHYAMALIKSGSRDEARRQLKELLAQSANFASRSEAEKALAELNGAH